MSAVDPLKQTTVDDPYDAIVDAAAPPSEHDPVSLVHSVAQKRNIPADVADDYLKLTKGAESGNRQFNAGGGVLTGPATKSGGHALGMGQVMPDQPGGHVRTIGSERFDLRDAEQNAAAGLAYFHAGGPDPIARRLYYFGGPKARDHYLNTGQIPQGGDGYTSFKDYVRKSGGFSSQQDQSGLYDPIVDAATAKPAAAPVYDSIVDAATPAPLTARERGQAALAKSKNNGVKVLTPANRAAITRPRQVSQLGATTPAAWQPKLQSEVGDTGGIVQPGNLDPYNRPIYKHPNDEGYGTTYSMSFEDEDGTNVLIPQIVNGKMLTQKQAIDHYRKTGEHFGKFKTWQDADRYAEKLHNSQDAYLRQTRPDLYGQPAAAADPTLQQRAQEFEAAHSGQSPWEEAAAKVHVPTEAHVTPEVRTPEYWQKQLAEKQGREIDAAYNASVAEAPARHAFETQQRIADAKRRTAEHQASVRRAQARAAMVKAGNLQVPAISGDIVDYGNAIPVTRAKGGFARAPSRADQLRADYAQMSPGELRASEDRVGDTKADDDVLRAQIRHQVISERNQRLNQSGVISQEEIDQPGYFSRENIDRDTEQRFQQTKQDASEFARVGYDRKLYNDTLDSMRNDPTWFQGIHRGAQQTLANAEHIASGLARIFFAGGPNATPAHDYLANRTNALKAALDTINSDVPLNRKQTAAAFVTSTIGDLAQIIAIPGGPITKFATLNAASAAGSGKPWADVSVQALKGGTLGGVFEAAPLVESAGAKTFADQILNTAKSGAVVAGGTYGTEKLFGSTDEQAAHAALTNTILHGIAQVAPNLANRSLTKGAEVAARAPIKGEWYDRIRSSMAEKGGLGHVVVVEDLPPGSPGLAIARQGESAEGRPNANVGRVLSVYGEPQTEGIGGTEINDLQAKAKYAAGSNGATQVVHVSPEEYQQVLDRIAAKNPEQAAQIAPPPPAQPQITETASSNARPATPLDTSAIDQARNAREAAEQVKPPTAAVTELPGVTKTRALDALDRANQAGDGEAVKELIKQAHDKGADASEIDAVLKKPSGAITPPTPDTPRVPEPPETLGPQFEAMLKGYGSRRAVLLPREAYTDDQLDSLPEGIGRAVGPNGELALFDLGRITATEVQSLLDNGESHKLTGLPNAESPKATVMAVARVAEGENKNQERLAGYLEPGNEDAFRKEATAQFPSETLKFEFGGKKTEEKVLKSRKESPAQPALEPRTLATPAIESPVEPVKPEVAPAASTPAERSVSILEAKLADMKSGEFPTDDPNARAAAISDTEKALEQARQKAAKVDNRTAEVINPQAKGLQSAAAVEPSVREGEKPQPLGPEVYPPAPERPADWITKPLAEQKRILTAQADALNEQIAQTKYGKPYGELKPEERTDVVRTKFRMSVAEQQGMTEREKNERAGIQPSPQVEAVPDIHAAIDDYMQETGNRSIADITSDADTHQHRDLTLETAGEIQARMAAKGQHVSERDIEDALYKLRAEEFPQEVENLPARVAAAKTGQSPKEVIEAAGLKYLGKQQRTKGKPPLHIFNEPGGSTLALEMVTPESVAEKLKEHKAKGQKLAPENVQPKPAEEKTSGKSVQENVPELKPWVDARVGDRTEIDGQVHEVAGRGLREPQAKKIADAEPSRVVRPDGKRFAVVRPTGEMVPAKASEITTPAVEYLKKEPVQAEVSDKAFDWKTKDGQTMHAVAGDWRVTHPNGRIGSVKPDVFKASYEPVEGKPGWYKKTAVTRAQVLDRPFDVKTLEGNGHGEPGDYLVTGEKGEQYIVQKQEFESLYRPVSGTKPASDETIAPSGGTKQPSGGTLTWEQFPESLGIPRAAMPQIDNAHRGAMVQFLKGRGIEWTLEDALPTSLKPTQAEFSPEKVEQSRQFARDNRDKEPRRIIVSDDNYVIDAHHQWKRDLDDEPAVPIPIIRLHAPANVIMLELARFPSSYTAGTHHEPVIEGSVTPERAERITKETKKQERDERLIQEVMSDVAAKREEGRRTTEVAENRVESATGAQLNKDGALADYINDTETEWPEGINKAEFDRQDMRVDSLEKAIRRPLSLASIDRDIAGQSRTDGPVILDDDYSVIDGMHRIADKLKSGDNMLDAWVRIPSEEPREVLPHGDRPRRNAINSHLLEDTLSPKAQEALAAMFKQRKDLGQRYIREAMEVYHRLLHDQEGPTFKPDKADPIAAKAVADAAEAYFLDETSDNAAKLQDATWEGLKIITGEDDPDPAELLENEIFADAEDAGRLIFDTLDPRTASFDTEEFNTAFGSVEFRRAPEDVFPVPKERINKHVEDPPPQKAHNYFPRPRDQKDPQITQAEANERIQSWKDFAKRVGKEEDHSNDVIISLYDVTGIWSQPYVDAGYRVLRYDIQSGQDLMKFGSWMADIEVEIDEGRHIVGILAQPPCTTYTLSGTRWWKDRHDAENISEVEKIGGLWATQFFKRPIDYANTLVAVAKLVVEQADPEEFYAMENPVGRIDTQNHLPVPPLKFNPYNYGDPYTKQTQIWGEFNPHLPVANVHPSEGQKIHKLRGDVPEQKAERSKTPEGFAYSFFVANNNSKLEFPGVAKAAKPSTEETGEIDVMAPKPRELAESRTDEKTRLLDEIIEQRKTGIPSRELLDRYKALGGQDVSAERPISRAEADYRRRQAESAGTKTAEEQKPNADTQMAGVPLQPEREPAASQAEINAHIIKSIPPSETDDALEGECYECALALQGYIRGLGLVANLQAIYRNVFDRDGEALGQNFSHVIVNAPSLKTEFDALGQDAADKWMEQWDTNSFTDEDGETSEFEVEPLPDGEEPRGMDQALRPALVEKYTKLLAKEKPDAKTVRTHQGLVPERGEERGRSPGDSSGNLHQEREAGEPVQPSKEPAQRPAKKTKVVSGDEKPLTPVQTDFNTLFDEVLAEVTAPKPVSIPGISFSNSEEANQWMAAKTAQYGSKKASLGSDEYAAAYPELKRLHGEKKAARPEPARVVVQKRGQRAVLRFENDSNAYVGSGGGVFAGLGDWESADAARAYAAKNGLDVVGEEEGEKPWQPPVEVTGEKPEEVPANVQQDSAALETEVPQTASESEAGVVAPASELPKELAGAKPRYSAGTKKLAPVSERHTSPGFEEYISDPAFDTAADSLVESGYADDVVLLGEEVAAFLADGKYAELGIESTDSERLMSKWFTSFAEKNGYATLNQFKELSDEAERARVAVLARRRDTAREPSELRELRTSDSEPEGQGTTRVGGDEPGTESSREDDSIYSRDLALARSDSFNQQAYRRIKPLLAAIMAKYKALDPPHQLRATVKEMVDDKGFLPADVAALKPHIVQYMQELTAPKAEEPKPEPAPVAEPAVKPLNLLQTRNEYLAQEMRDLPTGTDPVKEMVRLTRNHSYAVKRAADTSKKTGMSKYDEMIATGRVAPDRAIEILKSLGAVVPNYVKRQIARIEGTAFEIGKKMARGPVGRPKSDPERNSLSREVRAWGGIKPDKDQANRGEVDALRSFPGLVNESGGRSAEDLATAMAEQGYGRGVWWDGEYVTDVNGDEFLQAVGDDAASAHRHFSSMYDPDLEHPDHRAFDDLTRDKAGSELLNLVQSGHARSTDIAELTRRAKDVGLSDEALGAFLDAVDEKIKEDLHPETAGEGESAAAGEPSTRYSLNADDELVGEDGEVLFSLFEPEPQQLGFITDELTGDEVYAPPENATREEMESAQRSHLEDWLKRELGDSYAPLVGLQESDVNPRVRSTARELEMRIKRAMRAQEEIPDISDVLVALRKLDVLRRSNTPVNDYLNQGSLFGERSTTPEQEDLLKRLDRNPQSVIDSVLPPPALDEPQSALFGTAERTDPIPELGHIDGNAVSLGEGELGLNVFREAYSLQGYDPSGAGGAHEEKPENLVITLEDMAQDERFTEEQRDAADFLADAVAIAAENGQSVVLYSSWQVLAHERGHVVSREASDRSPVSQRHTADGYKRLEERPEFPQIKAELLRRGERDILPVLIEEGFMYLQSGDNLGLTDEQADAFMTAWLKSFKEKNGSPSINNFRELSDETEKIITKIYSDESTDSTTAFARGDTTEISERSPSLRSVPAGREQGTQGAHGEGSSGAQTDSPEFRAWFKDSQVVNDDGSPRIVFHGTAADFDTFDPQAQYNYHEEDQGHFFFTSDPEEAANYAEYAGQQQSLINKSVMPTYLSLQHPYISEVSGDTDPATHWDQEIWYTGPTAQNRMDYDGVIVKNVDDGKVVYIAFEPTQIKSAIANSGQFDPDNPNILMARNLDPWEALRRFSWELQQPEDFPTGIKNAVTAAERAAAGQDPVSVAARRNIPDIFDEARARFTPEGARDKAVFWAKSPRPLMAEETAEMIIYKTWLKNQYALTYANIEESQKIADVEGEEQQRIRLAVLDEDLQTYQEMAQRTGYEQGLGLRLRAEMMHQDYSLAEIMARAVALNGGEAVTAELQATIAKLIVERDAAIKALEKYDSEASQRAMEAELKKRRLDEERKQRAAEKSAAGVVRHEKRVEKKERLQVRMAAIDQQWRAAMMKAPANPFSDPTLLRLIGQAVQVLIEEGANSVAEIVDPIYQIAQENGPKEGTKRELMDAISGYGKVINMSKDEIDIRRRELKALMRDIAAVEDIEEGQRPMRTGLQRDKPTQRVRESKKRVQAALREHGMEIERLDTRSPEEKQQSALDTMKTSLRNRIEDLKSYIAGGERAPKRQGVEPDEEAKMLRVERDRLQAVLDEIEGPKQLTAEERIALAQRAIQKSIDDYRQRIAAGDIASRAQTSEPWSVELGRAKQLQAALRKQLANMRKASAHPTAEQKAVQRRLSALERSIARLEGKIKAGDVSKAAKAPKTPAPTSPAIEAAKVQRNLLNKILATMRAEAKKAATPEKTEAEKYASKLKSLMTRAEKRDKELADMLATGRFTKKPKPIPVDDPALRKLRAAIKEKDEKIEMKLKEIQRANRGVWQKIVGHVAGGHRAVVLSSTFVLGKLTNAAAMRIFLSIGEEIAGAPLPYLPIIGTVARQAPSEGYLSLDAEIKHIVAAFSREMLEQGAKVLKTGKMDIDVLYGKKKADSIPDVWYDFIGHIHGMLKTPAKLAQFERSFQKNLEWLARHGYDPTSDAMKAIAATRAVIDANRAILQQDNVVSDLFKKILQALEAKRYPESSDAKKATMQKYPTIAAALRFMMPVTRVPPNFIFEAVNYTPAGLVIALARLGKAVYTHGLDEASGSGGSVPPPGGAGLPPRGLPPEGNPFDAGIPPDEADAIIRGIKKSLLGSPFMVLALLSALGFIKFIEFGGYYERGEKRKKTDVPAGRVRILGHLLPSWMGHFPLLEAMQIVATAAKIFTRERDKDKDLEESSTRAAVNTFTGMASEVPFYEEQARMFRAGERPESVAAYIGATARGAVIPPDVQRFARVQDPLEPTTKLEKLSQMTGFQQIEPVKRKPAGGFFNRIGQEFETGVPRTPLGDKLPNRMRVSPDEKANRAELKQNFEDDIRHGRPVTAEMEKMVQSGDLRPNDRSDVARKAQLTPLQLEFKNKDIEEAMNAFARMPSSDQAAVKDLLITKGPTVYNLPVPSQPTAIAQFKVLTGEEPSKHRPRRFSPRWYNRLKDKESTAPNP